MNIVPIWLQTFKSRHYINYNNKLGHKGTNLLRIHRVESMASDSNLKPPNRVAGLTTLNKSIFEKVITVPYLLLNNEIKISFVMPVVRKYLLKLEHFKPVESISKDKTHIYLNPEIINKWEDFPAEVQKHLNHISLDKQNLLFKEQTLTYENFSLEVILRAVLPSDIEGMSSFTKVGHIVHVNLRDHLLPFKNLIGQVLFEKVKNCRSVVNKVANIDNTYRNFQMEILRGDDDMETTVKENKCTFKFDFSKVYWNSRLCTEHERIVDMIQNNDVVFDVFAGVGPFSIPLAKKKCQVFANDLNPDSYKWLTYNAKTNNINPDYLKCFNKDGREFILSDVKQLLPRYLNKSNVYILMNLPAIAAEFLSAFVDLYENEEIPEVHKCPTVIVYCFAKSEDCENIAKKLVLHNIGCEMSDKIIDIFRVRTVSSMKEMMRVKFRLDRDILVKSAAHKRKNMLDNYHEVEVKKCCHGEKQEEES